MSRASGLLPFGLVLFLVALSACAPKVLERGPRVVAPALQDDTFIAEDGARFRVRSWLPDGAPEAVIIAVHGINDRSLAFQTPAAYWRGAGLAVYAFDQRGFAQSPGRGTWPGRDNLVADLALFTGLVRARYPTTPIFLLGESMGGAVVLLAAASAALPAIEGAILVAPAAVTWETLPVYWRVPLWLLAHSIPWYPTSGRGLDLRPTDNIEAWYKMSADPDIIRRTRVDALYGLTQLIDAAALAAPAARTPLLVLYGRQDDFVRDWMFEDLDKRLPSDSVDRESYDDGHHWLLRDLGAEKVYRRIVEWIGSRGVRPAE